MPARAYAQKIAAPRPIGGRSIDICGRFMAADVVERASAVPAARLFEIHLNCR